MKYIEELITYKKDIDAIQIAEILWLSQFMSSESSEVEEKPKSTSDIDDTEIEEPIEEDLPSSEDEVPEPIDESTPIHEDKKQKYGFDKEQDNGSSYATNIVKKEKFPKIEKQFQSLKVKQNRISKQVLDEVKTADYIATTGYFHPIFSEIKSKESYFSLHIIIDKSESMFLWESYTNHFIKSMKFSTIFTHIHIFELDSSQKEPSVSAINSDHSINLDSAIFREEKSITLVFSDITGNSWKSNEMFKILGKWSKGSFVTIVSMLPKRMWKKTPLRQGISLFMKPKKFLPKNKDLKAEFNFTGIKTAEKGINIPMLTFDSYSFSHLSNVLMSKKDSWVDSRIFRNLVIKEVAKSKKSNISPKERVANFFSFALPKTRELAIYCSVLPLNQEIIREVIEKRDLGAEKDVFSEFYFGGLIDKNVKATFGEYAFYEGVAKELRQYISVQEMEILLHQVSEVMSSSFGVDTKKINLLYESVDGGEELNDNERALVELMIEVLEDKGRFYEGEVKKLREKFGSIEKEESFEIEESNVILLYKENDLDIDLVQIVAHLNKICNYLIFKVGEEPFELEEKIVTVPWSYKQLEEKYNSSTKNSLRAIFFTEKAYEDGFFFKPRTNDKDDNLRIVSFSGWDSLTTLSKNNGAVYFIAMLLALISERPIEHDNTGCVYDFLAIKNDIDNNMREAKICTSCLNIILEQKSFPDGRILDDLNSVLNFIGKISRNDLDVCAKGNEIEESVVVQLEKSGWGKLNIIQGSRLSNRQADLLLHYKDKKLAVIEVKSIGFELKEGLKQAINYGKQLNIDYVYATNGIEIYEYSIDRQKGKFIDKYPSPDELYLKCLKTLTPEYILRNIPYKTKIQRYHLEATVTINENIINENKRILLSLFIGAGKQTILFEVFNKLIESNWYKRKPKVLLLADKQSDIRFSERVLEELDIDITMFTYQKMAKKYRQSNPNTFDIVIIYEVPRMRDKVSKTNRWKEILDYFNSSTFISFTSLYIDTMKEYFGELKYKYTLEDSITDGISRPYKVLPRDLDLKDNFIKLVVSEVIQLKDMLGKIGKTVIVCDNDLDILTLSEVFQKDNMLNYIPILSNKNFSYKELNYFRNDDNIKIAIINKNMIDMGFNHIDNIILLAHIKSQYKFNYLLADGARKRNKTNLRQSYYFQIIDYFYKYHKDYYVEIDYEVALQNRENMIDENESSRVTIDNAEFFVYIVKKGDNLSQIAKEITGNASNYKIIQKFNEVSISNADIIYIGQRIFIPLDLVLER